MIFYGTNLSLTTISIFLVLFLKGVTSWKYQIPGIIRSVNNVFGEFGILPPVNPAALKVSESVSVVEEPPGNQEVVRDQQESPRTTGFLPYSVPSEEWTMFSYVLRLAFSVLFTVLYVIAMFAWLH